MWSHGSFYWNELMARDVEQRSTRIVSDGDRHCTRRVRRPQGADRLLGSDWSTRHVAVPQPERLTDFHRSGAGTRG